MTDLEIQCTSQESLGIQNTSYTDDESRNAISTQSILSSPKPESDLRRIDGIVQRICREKIPYIGIYKPGELGRETWRAVVPSDGRNPGKSKGRGKGRGRGLKGQWESIVLSTPSRGGIDRLVSAIRQLAVADGDGESEEEEAEEKAGRTKTGAVPLGVRHIVNPHCNQDEGLRIVWPTQSYIDVDPDHEGQREDWEGQGEMRDWSRRDRMMREGKTVRAVSVDEGNGQSEMDMGMEMGTGMGWVMPVMTPHGSVSMPIEMAPIDNWDNTAWTRLV